MVGEGSASAGQVVFKKGKGGKRRQRSSREDEGADDDITTIKQPKSGQSGVKIADAVSKRGDDMGAIYTGEGGIQQLGDRGATRLLEEDTDHSFDRRAQHEAFMRNDAKIEDSEYKGMRGYKDWRGAFRREANVPIHGPQRVSQFVRTTIRMDYQPDVCKDYKETGFCSYGDTCKFLHDRGDYKAGWELDRDWNEQQKAKRERAQRRLLSGKDPEESSSEEEASDADEDLPFACFLCREEWAECSGPPVKTLCEHYFCEPCALQRHAESKKCAVCEKQTQGIFNAAPELERKFSLREARRARAIREPAAPSSGGWQTEDAPA